MLTERETQRMNEVKKELEHIWKIDEIKAKQRSRDKNIKEGDRNTSYFQALANQRKRKKKLRPFRVLMVRLQRIQV